MHPGLQSLFRNLSVASKRVEERRLARDKLYQFLKTMKKASKSSVFLKRGELQKEMDKLEEHISHIIDRKLIARREGLTKEKTKKIKNKEELLDRKIKRVNQILSKLGKKVNERKFSKQLEKETKVSEPAIDVEEMLYRLEIKYYEIKENPKHSPEALKRIEDKISELKEKIRELKNK